MFPVQICTLQGNREAMKILLQHFGVDQTCKSWCVYAFIVHVVPQETHLRDFWNRRSRPHVSHFRIKKRF